MMTIGVTGGSGAGKTTVLHEAQRRGALILDCDEIYHELLETSGKMLAAYFYEHVHNSTYEKAGQHGSGLSQGPPH